MRQKLRELAEIIKTNNAIKERLEELSFGCWVNIQQLQGKICGFDIIKGCYRFINSYGNIVPEFFSAEQITEIVGYEPQFSDVLEFLGEDYLVCIEALQHKINLNHSNPYSAEWISLSPGPLSSQSDETLAQIILLCKSNVGQRHENK